MSQAKQYLNSRGVVTRSAKCPEHDNLSSTFLYADERGWVFVCPWSKHQFYAGPDPAAPKTVEEIKTWMKTNAYTSQPG